MNCNPVIVIPGIGQSELYVADKNGKKIKNAWPFELDEKALMNDLKGSLMKMMIFRTDGGFSDKIASVVSDITDPLAVNPDGTKKHNVQPVSYRKSLAECSAGEKNYLYKTPPVKELGEKIGEENVFFFAYDPFGNIYDTAASLNEFVSFVQGKTGSEKVNIISVSIGGAVLKAYLHKYGEKHAIEKVLNIASALDGAQLAADLFENKLKLENPAALLSPLGGKAQSLSSAVGMLPGDVMENIISKSLAVIRKNLISSCTSLWALIPNARFDAIYETVGNDLLAEKVKSYHDYSVNFAENVRDMKFYQLSGYGKELIPIVASCKTQSDGIIDTYSSSLGAVCGGVNEKPDVSGCVFPETTWFFKDRSHAALAYNNAAVTLAVKIMAGEIENVNSDPSYPQHINETEEK